MRVFFCILFLGSSAAYAQTDHDSYRDHVGKTVDSIAKSKILDEPDGYAHSLSLKTGPMQYQQGGFRSTSASEDTDQTFSLDDGINFSNLAIEFEWFQERNMATILGYRTAYNPDIKRTQYQAGYGGLRYFLYTTGAPANFTRSFSRVHYDFKFKPYVGSGISLGRYLAAVFGEEAALDVSSEFYGAYAELGSKFAFSQRSSINLSASYEVAKGYGPILFNAQTLFVQTGFHYYY